MKTEERGVIFLLALKTLPDYILKTCWTQELQTSDKPDALPLASMVLQYQMTVQRQVLLFNVN